MDSVLFAQCAELEVYRMVVQKKSKKCSFFVLDPRRPINDHLPDQKLM